MNVRRMLFIGLIIALAGSLTLSGCSLLETVVEDVAAAFQSEEIWEDEFQLDPETPVRISNRNGNVVVRTSASASEIHIRAEKRAFQRARLEDVEIVVDPGDPFTIETRYLQDRTSASVRLFVTVPPDTWVETIESSNGNIDAMGTRGDLRVSTSNGSVTLESIAGFVNATSSNGRITITDCQGVDHLRSSNGAIRAAVQAIRQDVTVQTSNGAIQLELAPTIDARIRATTSNGSVSHELDLQGVEAPSRTSLSGTLGQGEHSLQVQSSNGNVDLVPLR